MGSDARLRSLCTRMGWTLPLALCLGLLATEEPASGANKTPAQLPPGTGADARWNASSSIKPELTMEDFTWFAGHSDPANGNIRLFHAVDIENGILFAATGQGLEIFDIRQGPTVSESSYIYGYFTGGSFPGWYFAGDADWFVNFLDAPAGNSNILALSMDLEGFSIVNTTSPGTPVVAYHAVSPIVSTSQVYAVRAADIDWAYALNQESQVVRFNLSAASGMVRCREAPPVISCPNVYKGVVSSLGTSWLALHGAGTFLATGKWQQGGLIKIWSLADPASPSPLLQINAPAMGLAMWQSGSSYYLARIDTAKKLWIHDVSCVKDGVCTNAPVVWSQQLTSPSVLKYVTVSQTAGKTYLYLGGDDLGACVPQREYLFDVTSPAATSHDDLTPKIDPDGYWGWYYQDCSTGFNLVGPRIGKVYASTKGTHLYRAAMSILDAHTVVSQGVPPAASFSFSPVSPETAIYPGTEVQFTDGSSGNPTEWIWTFPDGSPDQ
jgi:hypothetical protein